MDVGDVWRSTDTQRASLADLLDDLSPAEWEAPSLCAGWRVRDVAAHLTQAHMGYREALVAAVRAGGSFDRMVRDAALRAGPLPPEECSRRLRAMVGSRRRAPMVGPVEPLTDVLVHGQDIAVPLGRARPVPPAPAAMAARRVWATGFPFRARRRLVGLQLRATDGDLVLGEGAPVEGTTGDLLLLLTGRTATVHRLAGEGVRRLPATPGRREERRGTS
ncbi:TIGR03083 family protein [Geodermatophilus pulveris]|uniref:TIGR03083 family protein n=1 Tax=Geodermatophilus pulveris TaxID=1564159 RepID=A0A239IJC4_9ACTN|nr:maleylpyruvate isomerase family mycothiol-dependent enzyme [Geodermatophilus pulveris]SNS93750.1 TIGR03083 family protein [Geodermatophilus pulveris]